MKRNLFLQGNNFATLKLTNFSFNAFTFDELLVKSTTITLNHVYITRKHTNPEFHYADEEIVLYTQCYFRNLNSCAKGIVCLMPSMELQDLTWFMERKYCPCYQLSYEIYYETQPHTQMRGLNFMSLPMNWAIFDCVLTVYGTLSEYLSIIITCAC